MTIKKLYKKIKSAALPVILSVLAVFALIYTPAFSVSADDLGNGVKVYLKTEGLEKPPDVTAEAAIILNTETGTVLYEKNSRKIIFPASTVKIMTAIVVLENVGDIESKVIISQYVINNKAGNSIPLGISEGEIFTVDNLLNAMLIQGANDAALALAEFVAGSVPEFVAKMNEKARELGCENTLFANPTGMHSAEMHTTVSDMAKIAFHASKIQKFMDISSSDKYTIPPTNKERESRTLLNHNAFISTARYPQYYYSFARGMNYGYTPEAGYCLTTIAEQTGLSYLCVVMNSTSTPVAGSDSEKIYCFQDAKSLFEWTFSIYSYKTIVSTKDKTISVEVKLSANRDNITLVPDADISVLLPQNADLSTEIATECDIFEEDLVAPIEKGQQLGKLTVLYNGEVVGTAGLLSNSEVERSNILFALDQIKEIVSGSWFQASVIIFIIIFAFYVVISLLRKNKKEQKRFY